jgi:hypothetical protein
MFFHSESTYFTTTFNTLSRPGYFSDFTFTRYKPEAKPDSGM